MSRPLRILFENAWYHVMNRGAAHAITFHDDNDYQTFLDLLLVIHRRYCFEIHAYCLMPNHYHILIRTPQANLSRGMRHLDGLYTQYYNKKYQKDGALFRGRYKAILVDAKNYLLRLSRYIHLNPIRAGLIDHPSKYPWSSYQFYSKKILPPDWIYLDETLASFGEKQRQNKYCLFVMGKTDYELESFYRKAKLLPILGSTIFREQIRSLHLGKQIKTEPIRIREIPDHKIVCEPPSVSIICEVVAKYYNVSVKALYCVKRKNGNIPRAVAIYLAAELSSQKFAVIADSFTNISNNGISKIVQRVNKLMHSNSTFAYDIVALRKMVQEAIRI